MAQCAVYAQRIPINANLTPEKMYEKALKLIGTGFKERGLGYLKMSAGKHYVPALKYLGQCYLEGNYVERDKQKAGEVFEISAKLGDQESTATVAQLVASGEYSPMNTTTSNAGKQVIQVINHYNVVETDSNEKKVKEAINIDALSDVDMNIPISNKKSDRTFVVIISNENYQEEENVEFAIHDGETFKEYCEKTLGVPKENIHFKPDATYNNIRSALEWLKQIANAYNGEEKFIFYYAGHGFPDESSRTAYLLPVDGKGNIVNTGYSLTEIYNCLGETHAENVLVFLDACFSGSKRGEGMLTSARGIAIKAKPNTPKGNMIVFSAANDDETAYPYKEKHHGLFTYYLLQELQHSKGECTLGELADYIIANVKKKSIVANRKNQTPTVSPSNSERDIWRNIKFN